MKRNRELNTQKTLARAGMKLTGTGWRSDVDVYNAIKNQSLFFLTFQLGFLASEQGQSRICS